MIFARKNFPENTLGQTPEFRNYFPGFANSLLAIGVNTVQFMGNNCLIMRTYNQRSADTRVRGVSAGVRVSDFKYSHVRVRDYKSFGVCVQISNTKSESCWKFNPDPNCTLTLIHPNPHFTLTLISLLPHLHPNPYCNFLTLVHGWFEVFCEVNDSFSKKLIYADSFSESFGEKFGFGSGSTFRFDLGPLFDSRSSFWFQVLFLTPGPVFRSCFLILGFLDFFNQRFFGSKKVPVKVSVF